MSMTKSCLGQLILTLKLPCWHRSGLQSNSSQWFYVKHTWSSELSAFSHQCQQWTRHNINKSHGSPRCCTGSACNTGLIIMYILCYCYADIFGESCNFCNTNTSNSYYHYKMHDLTSWIPDLMVSFMLKYLQPNLHRNRKLRHILT